MRPPLNPLFVKEGCGEGDMRPPQTPLRSGCTEGLQGVLVAPCSSHRRSSAAEYRGS